MNARLKQIAEPILRCVAVEPVQSDDVFNAFAELIARAERRTAAVKPRVLSLVQTGR